MKRVIKSIYFGTPGEADVLYKVSRYSAVGFRDLGRRRRRSSKGEVGSGRIHSIG